MSIINKTLTYKQAVLKFLLFLKENNALKDFKKAVREQKKSHIVTLENKINPLSILPIKRLFTTREYNNIIDYSFTWADTQNGHDFWDNLQYKWQNIVFEEKITIVDEKLTE